MFNVPALEIGTITLLTHNEKEPVDLGNNRYALTFHGYSDTYFQLEELIKHGDTLTGKMWINRTPYNGKIISLTPYVSAGWMITFQTE